MDNCPICFEDISITSRNLITQCGHRFHPDCLFKWFKTSTQCPICRNEMMCDGVSDKVHDGVPDRVPDRVPDVFQSILNEFVRLPCWLQVICVALMFMFMLFGVWIFTREAALEKAIQSVLMGITIVYILIFPAFIALTLASNEREYSFVLLALYVCLMCACVLMDSDARTRILNWHYIAFTYPMKDTLLVQCIDRLNAWVQSASINTK